MLTIWGERQQFCDGITRRGFLKVGAFGAGLTLAEMLRARALAGNSASSSKSAIMIYLPGGPSHMDMYDLKPEAPAEFRGEFKPIPTNGPGLQNLRLAGGVDAVRMEDRKSLLSTFDDVQRDIDATGTMRGLDAFTSRAFDMVASGAVRKALDLTHEEPKTRDRYKGVEQFL